MTSPDLSELIDRYLVALKDEWAAQTLRAYTADLRTYAQWLRAEQLEEEPPAVYRHVYQQGNWSAATRVRKRFVLMRFYDWASKAGLRPRDIANMLDGCSGHNLLSSRSRGPTMQEYRRVLERIPPTHLRDIILFRLLAEAGLRVGEAQQLRRDGVEALPDGGYALKVGSREQKVYVTEPDLVGHLAEYLCQLPASQELLFEALWNGRGGPLRQSTIHSLWRRYAHPVSVDGSPDQLRQLLYDQLARQEDSARLLREAGLKSDTSIRHHRKQREATAREGVPVPDSTRSPHRRTKTKRSF